MLKQVTAHQLMSHAPADVFWQARYHDFNVWSEHKRIEKLRYIHRNPVKRGLCGSPEDWEWSSFRHHLVGWREWSKSSLSGRLEEESSLGG